MILSKMSPNQPSEHQLGSSSLLRQNAMRTFTSVSLGDDDHIPMSKIQRADSVVRKHKMVLEERRIHSPDAVPVCLENVRRAEEARAQLEDTPENNEIGYVAVTGTGASQSSRFNDWKMLQASILTRPTVASEPASSLYSGESTTLKQCSRIL